MPCPGSRFRFLQPAFAIAPAIADLEPATHGEAISPEDLDAAEPEMDALRRTRAWGAGRVVFLDPARWYLTQGGPASLEASVAEIAAALAQAEPR